MSTITMYTYKVNVKSKYNRINSRLVCFRLAFNFVKFLTTCKFSLSIMDKSEALRGPALEPSIKEIVVSSEIYAKSYHDQ